MRYFRILGEITSGFGQQVADFLSSLKPGEQYGLEINSPGGSVVEGMYAYHKFLARKPEVAYIHSAASMATVLAQAAVRRVIARGGNMILHRPQVSASGDADSVRRTAEYASGYEMEMLQVYSSRTDKDVKPHMQSMEALAAEKAVDLGLADEVIEPAAIAAKTGERKMDWKSLVARVLGIKAEALPANEDEAGKLLEAKAAALEMKEADLKAEAEKQLKAAIVADALKAGRMTEAMSRLPAILALDSASLKALIESLPVVVPVARADLSNIAAPTSPHSPEFLKACSAMKVDPDEVAKVQVPADGIFRYVVKTSK